MKPNRILVLSAIAAAAVLSGCASPSNEFSNAPVYDGSAAYSASAARLVTVESVHPVQIKKNTNGTWQAIAAPAIGGVIGGMAGNTVGEGAGRQLATAIGATLGTAAGAALQSRNAIVPGVVFTVSFYGPEGKSTLNIVQEWDETASKIEPGWRPGLPFYPTPARLTRGAGSGDRVVPL